MSSNESDPTSAYWRRIARVCAVAAYRSKAASGRGVVTVAREGVLAFYDNRLPRGSMAERDRRAARFAAALAGVGVHVLVAATFPQSGPDDGRSLAIVLDARAGSERLVADCWAHSARSE
jgi:hypothetical protein